jgi:hypothetical protein
LNKNYSYLKPLFLKSFDSRHGWKVPLVVLYQMSVICVNYKSKMVTTAGQNVSIGPNGFFSETRNVIETKLYSLNGPLQNVLFKMAAQYTFM